MHNKAEGLYTCVVCGNQLFSSETKFNSGSGWPSFYNAIDNDRIKLVKDTSHGRYIHVGSMLQMVNILQGPWGLRYTEPVFRMVNKQGPCLGWSIIISSALVYDGKYAGPMFRMVNNQDPFTGR